MGSPRLVSAMTQAVGGCHKAPVATHPAVKIGGKRGRFLGVEVAKPERCVSELTWRVGGQTCGSCAHDGLAVLIPDFALLCSKGQSSVATVLLSRKSSRSMTIFHD